MQAFAAEAAVDAVPDSARDWFRPLKGSGRHWLAPVLSVAILVAAIAQIDTLRFAHIRAMVPTNPSFWVLFAAYYFAGPASEWIIFRRLWAIPASGIFPLVRKLIGNEILLGYIGEVYFYVWARRHARFATSPFGAVKDVAILSAIVGNVLTLVMIAAAWPFLDLLALGAHARSWTVSAVVVLGLSLAVLVFRNRLFSLPARDLRMIAAVHTARIVFATVLAGLLWHDVLPGVGLEWWVLLATLRMIVSRLPLVPNKDVVFAGIAVLLVGQDAQVTDLMMMMASLILGAHLVLAAALGIAELTSLGKRT